ncbi:hypothetical protein [Fluoribacter gormanii]|uniref:Lipoprotein n=1 Tax=Fluoribacter gormanii TaxID=464 RepID=A0A377GNF1_9GAMM|nr:hypothetical protein [Fluoribacter gormanii]SIR86784.1 hypothetical protein SAMN05421777_13227 [Fluoribacter gormanii]STO26319.1 Uncharacterised protein [Fluoribacter gormanii]
MSPIKLLKTVILAICFIGVTVSISSCNTNQPISTSDEKGYGGEGGGGH